MSGLVFQPMVPVFIIAAMAGAAVALACYAYVRGAGKVPVVQRVFLAALRCIGIVVIAAILLKPMRPVPTEKPGQKPVLSVLLDTSRSMNVADVDGKSRFAAEKKLVYCAKGLFADLSREYEIEFHEFSEKVASLTADEFQSIKRADGGSTDLVQGILTVADRGELTRAESAGVLIVSDGHDNGAGSTDHAARHARSLNVPLWTCCIGSEKEVKDVSVVSRTGRDFVFVNQKAAITADIFQQGYGRTPVRVRLLREGGKVVGEKWVAFKGEPKEEVSFPIVEREPGVVKYTLLADPLDDEATVENNHRTVFLSVIAEKIRVLLLEGEPYWDSKFLAQTLRQDPNVALTSISQLSRDKVFAIGEDEREETGALDRIKIPDSRKELFAYDIIILGKLIDSMVDDDYVDLLKTFLTEKGGTLIFARGKPNLDGLKDLEKLSPVVWADDGVKNFTVEVTSEGRSNPCFALFPGEPTDVVVRKLPRVLYAERPERQKSLAVTLARVKKGSADRSADVPLVVFQRYGKGKTLSVSASGLWRWAFLPDRLKQYDTVYARFWGQMLRWLMAEADFAPGSDVAFQTSAMSYSMGDEVKFYVRTRLADQGRGRPTIEVRGPNGKSQEITLYSDKDLPGTYTASYFPQQQGEHTAILHGKRGQAPFSRKTQFAVYADTLEDLRCAAKPKVMKRLAELSGGAVIPANNLDLLRDLLKAREREKEKEIQLAEIWDRNPVFWFIAAVFGIEWFLRRRNGLV